MRLPAALCLALLLAPGASANEPLWTQDHRQANRDAVFAGRVESTARLYEVETHFAEGYEGDLVEEVWVARVEVLDVRKGHPLLEAGPVVDVYFVRPDHGISNARYPGYVELAPGEERLFFAEAARYPVTGDEALFVEMGSDVGAGVLSSPRTGRRLVTESWRVWSPAIPGPGAGGSPIHFSLSGRAWSDHLAGVERWQLTADGTLELLSEAGAVSYRFRPRAGSFFAHSFGEGLPAEQVVWVGIEGSDFEALSSRPPGSARESRQGPSLDRALVYQELRGPVPEVVEYFAAHGILLERSYLEDLRTTEYRVVEPATEGFRVRLRIWRFPSAWTESEIRDYLVSYSLGSVVNGRYVLWWPTGEDVDERERLWFESIQLRILQLFEEMDLEG